MRRQTIGALCAPVGLLACWLASSAHAQSATSAHAAPATQAVVAQVVTDDDAEDLQGLRARGGLLLDYRSPLHHAGLAVQNTRYSQDGWSRDVPGIVGIYRDQQPGTLEGVRAEAGLVSVEGHARVVGDVTWTLRPREATGVELIAAGDLVGTREALAGGIAYGLAAASVEQRLGERFTGIALAGWQPFTDGNSRALLRARMIYSVVPDQGLSAQLRWRQYSSSGDDVRGAYFNPDEYRQWDAVLSLRRRFGAWAWHGLAGAGRERIEDEAWQSTGTFELRGDGPLAGDARLEVSILYSRSAGFVGGDDYWYGSVGLNVVVPF